MSRLGAVLVVFGLLGGSAMGLCAGLHMDMQLGYEFEVGAMVQNHLAAKIEGLEMGGGLPVAATGSVNADVALEVLAVGEEDVATVQMSFGQLTSEFMGEESVKDGLEPVQLEIDALGRAVAAGDGEMEFDLLASGGIPIQLLGLLAGVAELPAEAIGLGEEWVASSEVEAPGVGIVAITTTSHIEGIGVDTLTIKSSIEAKLPDFTTGNPMGAGEITVKEPVLTFEEMTRTVDMRTGFVAEADGSMVLSCLANMGGMGDMPLKVLSSFSLRPVEDEQQAALPREDRQETSAATTAKGLAETAITQLETAMSRLARLWQQR